MLRDCDVVVVGAANMDYLARGPTLPMAGGTVQGSQFQKAPGGRGANQAIAAARFGARTALVACIGADDAGDAVLARLTAEGVDTRYVRRDETAPTGVALIHVDHAGEKQILTRPGANLQLSPADVHTASGLLRSATVLLLQLEPRPETVMVAVQLSREARLRIVLDPAPARELPDPLLQQLDVIRPNASEAEVLTGVHVTDRDSAREAARALLARGAGAAIVEAGSEGDLAVWSDGEKWLPRFKVSAVDSTGAGDAFAAGVAAMLAAGQNLVDAASFGSAAAALTTTKLGAQAALPHREEVVALMKRGAIGEAGAASESVAAG